MADNPASIFYSPAIAGDAQVLGPVTAVRAIGQIQRQQTQQALLAARLKQQQEQSASRDIPLIDANGSARYQPEVVRRTKEAYDKSLDLFKQAAEGKISRLEARVGSLQEVSNVKRYADLTNDLDKREKEALAVANDKRYVKGAYQNELNNIYYRTGANGQRELIPAEEIDVNAFSAPAGNFNTYNESEVVNKFLDELGSKEEKEYTEAARPGVAGLTRRGASTVFAYDDQARPLYTTDSQGRRVRQVANLPMLEEAAMRDPFMAGILRKNAEAGQAPSAAALMGLAPSLRADEADAALEALNAQTDPNTPHARQIMADIVRNYGTSKETTRELSPKAFPRTSSSSVKPKGYDIVPDNGELVSTPLGGTDAVPNTGTSATYPLSAADPLGIINPTTINSGAELTNGIYNLGVGNAPARNDGKEVSVSGLQVKNIERRGSKGGAYQSVNNNAEPFNGVLGSYFYAAADPKTGERLQGLSTTQQEQMVREGKASLGTFVLGTSSTNKNFIRDSEAIYQQLKSERDNSGAVPGLSGYKPDSDLREEANKQAMQGSEPIILHYDDQSAREFDGRTSGYYQAGRARAKQMEAQLRASKSAPTRPSFLKPKAGATQQKTKPTADRSGGMLN